jgi:hypothetical protein
MIGVRYGIFARGKWHLTPGPDRSKPIAESYDFDALCGRTPEGLSPCTIPLDRLISAFGIEAICKPCKRKETVR